MNHISNINFKHSNWVQTLETIELRGATISSAAVAAFPRSSQRLKSFDLHGTSFNGPFLLKGNLSAVPDLRGTRSSHQMELSSLKVKLHRLWTLNQFPHKLSSVAKDPDDAARLRRLKEIAETNKDHQAAQRFAADENRALRWRETSWLGSILDMAFSAFSDYGQNILRPFSSLLLLTLTCFGLYKSLERATVLPWETSWGHAATLAASNSLPFLPQSRSLRDDAIEVLYCDDPSLLVDAIMIGQGAISFIFLFLIGLGLRNRFRL